MAIMLQANGLHTFYNNLSQIPEGALLEASNIIIDRNGVVEPRRGFKQYGTISNLSTDRARALFAYKGTILANYDSKLAFDQNNSGTFVNFNGSYSEVDAGLRIKGLEANGNFYFTSSDGIKKISATNSSQFNNNVGYIKDAGASLALDVTAIINYSTPGFFLTTSKVAYRVLWAYRDTTNNLVIGAPSSSVTVTNISSTLTGTVDLSFAIPDEITSDTPEYFYQIYRTAVAEQGSLPSLDDVNPGDEMYLVYEDYPTPTQLTNRLIDVNDIVPESFREEGALLYTNLNSGEGINQANTRPPLSKDMALFQGSVFYANTRTKYNTTINLLSTSGLTNGTSNFIITDGTTTNTYTFYGLPEITDTTFDTFANTTDGGYFLLHSAGNLRSYFVWMDKTGTTTEPSGLDTVGKIPIRVNISSAVSANDIASAVNTALNLTDDFTSTVLGATVTITTTENGNTTDATDGLIGVGGVFAISVTQQGTGEDIATQKILISGAATPSQQIDTTARSIVRVINQNPNEIVYAFYNTNTDQLPGQITLVAKDFSIGEFYLLSNSGNQFNPSLPSDLSATVATGIGTVTITSAAHGFSNGDIIVLFGSTTTPNIDGIYTISNVTLNTFDISTTVTVAGSAFVGATTVNADNEVIPNRVYFSKYQQPEAVPIVNYIDVGPKDKEIKRILALRDSLIILKEDGIYRITGNIAPDWVVNLFDNSALIIAPDTAVILNNQIYALTNQGVTRISDNGVGIISRPIENLIKAVTTDAYSYSTVSFGISYETDRAYILYLPTTTNDTQDATQAFRFNTFTNAWTRWDRTNVSGVVNSRDDKLYLGAGSNYIEQERKNLNRTDQADYEYSLQIPPNSINDTVVGLSSNLNITNGDVILQTQYVTISQFNRLLKKLDMDIFLSDSDYYSTLGMEAGNDLTDQMQLLVNKLNSDPSTTLVYTFSGTTNFQTIQTEYNVMIDTLNSDPGVFYANYQHSTGTVSYEAPVVEVIKNTNRVIIDSLTPFLEGNIIHYVGIDTITHWAPQHFSDPSLLKQIGEATVLFENNIFTRASIAYNSDMSPNFEEVSFNGAGISDWGLFEWGVQNWGGDGSQIPIRTFIPLEKQRCRFLKCKFEHKNAREQFSLYGISFTPRVLSTRGYR